MPDDIVIVANRVEALVFDCAVIVELPVVDGEEFGDTDSHEADDVTNDEQNMDPPAGLYQDRFPEPPPAGKYCPPRLSEMEKGESEQLVLCDCKTTMPTPDNKIRTEVAHAARTTPADGRDRTLLWRPTICS